MFSKFRDILRFGCLEGTVLGLKYFYIYPNKISRCFWSTTLVLVCLLAIVLTLKLWGRFIAMPTRITIEEQNAPITRLPYPAITLCSPNQMTSLNVRHFEKTLVDGNMSIDLSAELPQLLGFYEQVAGVREPALKQMQELLDLNRHNVRDVMMSLPLSCERFLRRCLLELRVVPCEELFRPLLTARGLCCVFNSPYHIQNMRVVKDADFQPRFPLMSSILSGLVIVTDFMPQEALEGTLRSAGATKLMLHDHTEFPSDDESVLVPPHLESIHPISASLTYCSDEVAELDQQRRKCVLEGEKQLQHFRGYRNSDCDAECVVRAILSGCRCVLLFVPLRAGHPYCNLTSVPCIMRVKRELTHKSTAGENCDCPRQCFSRQYKIDSSLGNLGAYQHMFNSLKFEGVRFTNSSNIIYVSFATPFYKQNKQETVMSIINFFWNNYCPFCMDSHLYYRCLLGVSACACCNYAFGFGLPNLGGVFGLCLGCSMLSVLEILFYMYVALRNVFRVIRQRHHSRNMPTRVGTAFSGKKTLENGDNPQA